MFIELTPAFLVDPTEVAATSEETKTKTRVYLRGSGASQYVVVDLPIAEVVTRLLTRSPRTPERESLDRLLRPARPAPRPRPRSV